MPIAIAEWGIPGCRSGPPADVPNGAATTS